jgi:hypothetical protein
VLTGRDPEFERFTVLLERLQKGRPAKSLLVTGLRGVGKTVLLNSFADRAQDRKWVALVSELQTKTVLSRLIARQVRKALLALSHVARAKAQATKALSVLKAFSVSIGDLELKVNVDAAEGVADSGDLEEDLGELLVELGLAARAARKGVVLLLDEMQLLGKSDLEALIAALHKVSQKNLPVAFVGVGLPLLPKLAGEAKSYAERLFDFRKIGSLSPSAARDALVQPARAENVEYELPAVNRILELSERYPYFLQEYGKHVWNVAERSPITLKDVDRAHPTALAELDEGFYEVRLERTPASERKYMLAMAALGGDGRAKSGEVARLLGHEGPGGAAVTRDGLLKKGLVYSPRYGDVDFTVPRFAAFLARTSADEIDSLKRAARRLRQEHRARATAGGGDRRAKILTR